MKKIQKNKKWEAFSKRKQIDLARFLRNASTLEEALRIFEVNKIDPPSIAEISLALFPSKDLIVEVLPVNETISLKEELHSIEKEFNKKKSKKKSSEDEEIQNNEEINFIEDDSNVVTQYEQ
jgi:hypothetical protein